jgi:hypothetical protein
VQSTSLRVASDVFYLSNTSFWRRAKAAQSLPSVCVCACNEASAPCTHVRVWIPSFFWKPHCAAEKSGVKEERDRERLLFFVLFVLLLIEEDRIAFRCQWCTQRCHYPNIYKWPMKTDVYAGPPTSFPCSFVFFSFRFALHRALEPLSFPFIYFLHRLPMFVVVLGSPVRSVGVAQPRGNTERGPALLSTLFSFFLFLSSSTAKLTGGGGFRTGIEKQKNKNTKKE